ncbi:MAG: phosphonoacetate hydrolase [Edaphobacter sp.]|uniref:phosphonoacetate hydrolase n=1 Tax=Edaphobacter sp. TaxID=1934404 RepID=UPI002386F412|nr:phosphonoacetate hydrolase [Edaphobacter sp.]MDE1177458.1 phosphonoacetate hydrolase [Edaphobacter sp.]
METLIRGEEVIKVNGRSYRLDTPPVVAVCLDGTDPSYLEACVDVMPNLAKMMQGGAQGIANSAIPSFTNPNNVAIATGVPAKVNGISGNFYYDAESGAEVMMNSPEYLRCGTLFAAMAQAGRSVAVVTAKDKLRSILGYGLDGICFSVEKAQDVIHTDPRLAMVAALRGGTSPGIYDPEASIYCLEAGAAMLEAGVADLLYLSTTDYVQHKAAPDEELAHAFYKRVDEMLGRLHATGAIVAVTADHGMNAKTCADGTPRVRFLETLLNEAGFEGAFVILPITDPYVLHHGALGSYATVYLPNGGIEDARAMLAAVSGVEQVLSRDEAAKQFLLPEDRIGDLVVLGDHVTTFGRTPEWHDLSGVHQGLRSHGGLHERSVPFVINRPLLPEYAERLASGFVNNYDIYDFALNGTQR